MVILLLIIIIVAVFSEKIACLYMRNPLSVQPLLSERSTLTVNYLQ